METAAKGSPESFVHQVRAQHHSCSRYFDCNSSQLSSSHNQLKMNLRETMSSGHNNNMNNQLSRLFGVKHFAGNVVYDASNFLETNSDIIPDDIVAVFHKSACHFGFVSHLFGLELKTLFARDQAPCGLRFRIAATNHNDMQHSNDISSTLTQDFHTRLDNLLRTLVHAKPHFIRCIKVINFIFFLG